MLVIVGYTEFTDVPFSVLFLKALSRCRIMVGHAV